MNTKVQGPSLNINPVDAHRSPSIPKGEEGRFKEQLQALQQGEVRRSEGLNKTDANLKFSNHAIERMRVRGLSFSPDQMDKIHSAVGKAAAKGSKETLLLTDEAALIVSIKDKTVVTVMDKATLKENVFTNIDSTVVI